MAEPIESGSRTTAGAYSLPVPAWATVMDYVIVSGGEKGGDGTNFSSGQDGADGRVMSGSARVRPGVSLSCSIGGPGNSTSINFVSLSVNSDSGPRHTGSVITVPSVREGDPSVSVDWSVDIGSRGNGGAGGDRGYPNREPPKDPENGSPGTGGGLFWRFRRAAQMPRIGNIAAHDVKIGGQQVQAIYIGTKKVWEKSVN